jgi:hypothetical protein
MGYKELDMANPAMSRRYVLVPLCRMIVARTHAKSTANSRNIGLYFWNDSCQTRTICITDDK